MKPVRVKGSGLTYANDFLLDLEESLEQLALDLKKSNPDEDKAATKLLTAASVIQRIRVYSQ